MFSKEQIKAGIELAQAWYEAWRLDELEPEQIIEAIEKAQVGDYQALLKSGLSDAEARGTAYPA